LGHLWLCTAIPVGRRYLFGRFDILGSGNIVGKAGRLALGRSGPPYRDSRVGLPRAWVTSGFARRLRWAVATFSAGSTSSAPVTLSAKQAGWRWAALDHPTESEIDYSPAANQPGRTTSDV
jgi:hypothetical protein